MVANKSIALVAVRLPVFLFFYPLTTSLTVVKLEKVQSQIEMEKTVP